MTAGEPTADAADVRPSQDTPRMRRCLRCRATFPSEWSGERICRRCKGTSTWRNGAPIRSAPSRTGR